jgi:hypothetical protein
MKDVVDAFQYGLEIVQRLEVVSPAVGDRGSWIGRTLPHPRTPVASERGIGQAYDIRLSFYGR